MSEVGQNSFRHCSIAPLYAQVDVDAVDFGLVSYSYRYTKEFTLKNVCPIPMQYEWRLPKDHQVPAKKEFTVSRPDIFWLTLECIRGLLLHAMTNTILQLLWYRHRY